MGIFKIFIAYVYERVTNKIRVNIKVHYIGLNSEEEVEWKYELKEERE